MGKTTIEVSEEARDLLRQYKSYHGITYDEAIRQLLGDEGAAAKQRKNIECPDCGRESWIEFETGPVSEYDISCKDCGTEKKLELWPTNFTLEYTDRGEGIDIELPDDLSFEEKVRKIREQREETTEQS